MNSSQPSYVMPLSFMVFQIKNKPQTNFNSQKMKLKQMIKQNSSSPPSVTKEINPTKKGMKWGEPTWFLFHSLASKVLDEEFNSIRKDLLNYIYLICLNLPCQNCSGHATTYLKNNNYQSIQTKEQLKKMLFTFHNHVNSKKNYPVFTWEEYENKYSKSNLLEIIKYFLIYFKDKTFNIHMLSENMQREIISNNFMKWFDENKTKFSLN